jgi:hypothetical protein
MKKLATLIATAGILAGAILGAPAKVSAAGTVNLWVNNAVHFEGSGTSCKDPNYTNLQEALDAYEDNDIIFLCAGTYVGPFLASNGDLTIRGAGATKSIINGDGAGDGEGYSALKVGEYGPCFDGFCPSDLRIENLTITNGNATDGPDSGLQGYGGAVVAWSFTCVGSTLSNNSAEYNGGAVWAAGNVGTTKCSYLNNTALYAGGAIYAGANENNETMADNGGVYTSNRAGQFGGAVVVTGGFGGYGTFTKSTFTGNYTCWDICDDYSAGGAIFSPDTFLNIIASKFTKNHGLNAGGAILAGKGADIYTSTFTGNWSEIGGAIATANEEHGFPGGDLYLDTNTFKTNTARYFGAAVYASDWVGIWANKFDKSTFSGFTIYAQNCLTTWGSPLKKQISPDQVYVEYCD